MTTNPNPGLTTEIIVIMDRSGSMHSTQDDAIGGFNSFAEEQRKVGGQCRLTLAQFNTDILTCCESKDIADVEPLNNKSYAPDGMTALLDAVGVTVTNAKKRFDNLSEDKRPEKVFVVVITDGHENSSREYKKSQIKDIIEQYQNEHKWEFIFLGANIDAFAEGGGLGVAVRSTLQYGATSVGTRAAYTSLSGGLKKARLSDAPNAKFTFTDEDREAQEGKV